MIYAPPANLPMRKTNLSNPAKDNKYPKKRSRLQCPMKLTSSPHEISFDAHRSLYTQKAQLARTKCKLGYISLSSQIVKKLLHHF